MLYLRCAFSLSFSQLNSDISVRYNAETDYVQALYNNVWRDIFKAYLQSYALFANGNYTWAINDIVKSVRFVVTIYHGYHTMNVTLNNLYLQN